MIIKNFEMDKDLCFKSGEIVLIGQNTYVILKLLEKCDNTYYYYQVFHVNLKKILFRGFSTKSYYIEIFLNVWKFR